MLEKGDNPYDVLGVPQNASEGEVKIAYHKAARKHHPDKQVSKTEEERERAALLFSRVKGAYDVLKDPVKRYDWRMANKLGNSVMSSKINTSRTTSSSRPSSYTSSRPSTSVFRPFVPGVPPKRQSSPISPGIQSRGRQKARPSITTRQGMQIGGKRRMQRGSINPPRPRSASPPSISIHSRRMPRASFNSTRKCGSNSPGFYRNVPGGQRPGGQSFNPGRQSSQPIGRPHRSLSTGAQRMPRVSVNPTQNRPPPPPSSSNHRRISPFSSSNHDRMPRGQQHSDTAFPSREAVSSLHIYIPRPMSARLSQAHPNLPENRTPDCETISTCPPLSETENPTSSSSFKTKHSATMDAREEDQMTSNQGKTVSSPARKKQKEKEVEKVTRHSSDEVEAGQKKKKKKKKKKKGKEAQVEMHSSQEQDGALISRTKNNKKIPSKKKKKAKNKKRLEIDSLSLLEKDTDQKDDANLKQNQDKEVVSNTLGTPKTLSGQHSSKVQSRISKYYLEQPETDSDTSWDDRN
jgi:curved DNA-binding protein CbpA